MDQIIRESIFKDLILPKDAVISFSNKILKVTKWNWNFDECLNFQKIGQEIIRKNRDHKIYIFCNHPHCFTLGRGNERGQDELVSFDETSKSQLSFPLYKIHRGGGITFHFPGQWIFYPICSISSSYSLEDHMCWLLKSVKSNLEKTFKIERLMATKKLMGIWHGRNKLASIGVGVNRFVTEHGLALNLKFDEAMLLELQKISPCGINPTTYSCVDNILPLKSDKLIERFHEEYLLHL